MLLAKTLSAYIARQFFAWFCGVYGAMLSISFLIDYIELLRRGSTKAGVTLGVLLEMAALKLPHTAQEVMPFAVLFGTMLAFWRLTRNNELVVARAAGVSVWQFLTPAVLVALLTGIIAVTIFNPAASQMEATYEQLDSRYLKQSSDELTLSNSGLWLRQSEPSGGQVVIHGDKLVAPELLLGRVTLFFFNAEHQYRSRIEAQKAAARRRLLDHRQRSALAKQRSGRSRYPYCTCRQSSRRTGSRKASPHPIRCRSGSCLASYRCLRNPVSRRSATDCISTSCLRARFCSARWCWSRRLSACGCSGAAAPR